MLRAGDMVGDRYVVIEQIATGGMGTLWRAHHVELDVDVALKVLAADVASPDLIKRFKREAQASARLRSPNIVHVLDYGVHHGQPYLAMELLRGEDLAQRLTREGKLSVADGARIMRAVARAMQLAHDAGIVHRDVKPANIFLEKIGDDEIVKVLDFGVAKDLRANVDSSGTTGSGVVGSPAYMSPEQVWGEKVDHRTDVWAMGVVTFEMLTGHCPFADATLAKIFERIIRAPMPKIRDFNPALPPSLDAFFDRALARAPADRIGSAREFGDAFRRALAEEPAALHGQALTRTVSLSSPRSGLATLTQDADVPLAETEPPPAPPLDGLARVSRRRPPLRLGLRLGVVAVAVLGAGLSLRLALRSEPAPRPEVPELSADAAPSIVVSSSASVVREAPPVALTNTGPQPRRSTAPTASAQTLRPVQPRPHTSSTATAPTTAGSARGPDPTFGIPLPP